jgi:hypothetical protein
MLLSRLAAHLVGDSINMPNVKEIRAAARARGKARPPCSDEPAHRVNDLQTH